LKQTNFSFILSLFSKKVVSLQEKLNIMDAIEIEAMKAELCRDIIYITDIWDNRMNQSKLSKRIK